MPPAPMPTNEQARVAALVKCGVLDTAPEPAFDAITHLAQRITGAPIALISLIDSGRQWFKSSIGLDAPETPRDHAFCAHAILGTDPLVITDATLDPRTADNPLVTGDPGIRFYAGVPLVLNSGEALGTLCVIDTRPRDISDQDIAALSMLAHQACSQLELRFRVRETERVQKETRTILDALPAYVYYKDADNRILDLNASAAEALGRPREQVVGRHTSEFFPESDAAAYHKDDLEVIRSGSPKLGIEEAHEARPGNRRIIRTDKIPLQDETGEFTRIVAIAADVTELRRTSEMLARKNEELERFVYTVSHDLKSPLLTIIGYAEMGSEEYESLGKEGVRDSFHRIAQAGRRLEHKIQDLLELSRLGMADRALAQVDLGAHAAEVIASLPMPGDAPSITRSFDVPTLSADPAHITQIFQNLISNAIAYGCPSAGARIEIGSKNMNGSACLYVADNGPGIAPEHQERVFGLFQRLSTDKASSGVGLAIVKRVAELYGGRAWVESGRGEGATFFVSLPDASRPRAGATIQPAEAEVAA